MSDDWHGRDFDLSALDWWLTLGAVTVFVVFVFGLIKIIEWVGGLFV